MKFRIFGGLDCPDYLLAQFAVATQLNAGSISKITEHIISILLTSSSAPIDEEELGKINESFFTEILGEPPAGFFKGELCEDYETERMELAMVMSAVGQLLSNFTRFDVSEEVAQVELSMLGLEAEVSAALVALYKMNRVALREAAAAATPRLPVLLPVKGSVANRVAVYQLTQKPQDGEDDPEIVPRQVVRIKIPAASLLGNCRFNTAPGELASLPQQVMLRGAAEEAERRPIVVVEIEGDKARALLADLVAAKELIAQQNTVM